MKKRYKLLSFFSIFILFLVSCLKINVFAFQSENENELSNITNYWDLDNISISSNYSDYENYFSIENNLATISGYGLMSSTRKISFDLSYLTNDNYIILCFNDYNQSVSSSTNDTTYLGVSTTISTGVRSFYGSNIISYKFTKSDTNKYMNFGINFLTYNNVSSIHFKFYLYKTSEFFNSSTTLMYDSIYDFMFDSNISEYINKSLYSSLLSQYNDLISSTSLYLSLFSDDNVSSIVYYTNNVLNDYEPISLLDSYFTFDNHFMPNDLTSYQIIISFNQLMPSNNFFMKPSDNNIYYINAYNNDVAVSNHIARYNENYENDSYSFNLGSFDKLIIDVSVVNLTANNWQMQIANDYNSGYQNGYSSGYNGGLNDGYSEGYSYGYNIGYQTAFNQSGDGKSLYNMVIAIADTPINIFKQIFDFEILGINISNLILGLCSVLIVLFIIKFFI